jgi:hypothetical protein
VQSELDNVVSFVGDLCSRFSTCLPSWTGFRDSVKIRLSVQDAEEWINEANSDKSHNFQVHRFQTADSKNTHLLLLASGPNPRSAHLSSLWDLLPSEVQQSIVHVSGLTSFPVPVVAHGFRAKDTRKSLAPLAKKLGASAPEAGKKPAAAANPKAVRPDEMKFERVDLTPAPTAAVHPALSNSGNVGGLQNDPMLTVVQPTAGEKSVYMLIILWCSLDSGRITIPLLLDGAAYCGDSNPYSSGHITVTNAWTGEAQSASLPMFEQVNIGTDDAPRYVAGISATVPIDTDYVQQYFSLSFDYSGYSAGGSYPFGITATPAITPHNFKTWYALDPSIKAVNASFNKLGIGALSVQGGPGFYSPSDLNTFWQNFPYLPQPPLPSTTTSWTDYSAPKETNDPSNPDGETELDIQFGMGILGSNKVTGQIYHINSSTPFTDLMNGFFSDPGQKPTVLSFSYGGPEACPGCGVNASDYSLTNTKFRLAALMGISVFVSSGDTGKSAATLKLNVLIHDRIPESDFLY